MHIFILYVNIFAMVIPFYTQCLQSLCKSVSKKSGVPMTLRSDFVKVSTPFSSHICRKCGYPKMDRLEWKIPWIPVRMDDLGVPPFQKRPRHGVKIAIGHHHCAWPFQWCSPHCHSHWEGSGQPFGVQLQNVVCQPWCRWPGQSLRWKIPSGYLAMENPL